MVKTVVLSTGGGIINPEGMPDVKFLQKLGKLIEESKYNFGIVAGGGRTARFYAQAARDLGASEFEADEVGIISTKQNASLVITALGDVACPKVAQDFDEAREMAGRYKAVVMGGTIPGISTDADASLLAEALHAERLVNMSNVDAIYDSNPRTNPNAKKLAKMSYSDLIMLAMKGDTRKAGENFVFDSLACKIIARSKIEAHFVNGRDLENVRKAIDGKEHSGTIVKS
ncbi:UMP kinase [Candidatus Micrarchaeota archaeon]|nr:UMP kinase [Candidatus Micrarchaeota archaeon]